MTPGFGAIVRLKTMFRKHPTLEAPSRRICLNDERTFETLDRLVFSIHDPKSVPVCSNFFRFRSYAWEFCSWAQVIGR